MLEEITKDLSPSQLKGVTTLDRPVVVFAGAGSGKTRVLTHRIAYIISEGLAKPYEVLGITFTNKAANEMSQRIFSLLAKSNVQVDAKDMWISTFHAFGARILRKHASLIGYDNFTIFDKADQLSQIKKVMNKLDISSKVFEPKLVLEQINKAKRLCLDPYQFETQFSSRDKRFVKIYEQYEKDMFESKSMDFTDLLYKLMLLFENDEILEKYSKQFKFINVDEYQDTNRIQYLLLKKLLGNNDKIFAVGDEDQSIYSWRGADIDNILSLKEDFPDIEVIKLEENYRSTKTIVSAASSLISNNVTRTEKSIFSNKVLGELISVRLLDNEYEEARFVASQINSFANQGFGFEDFAVFYRTHAQSRVLEEKLVQFDIPYRIIGGMRFYERKEIKDVISYFRLALNPDDDVSFMRASSLKRGIGSTTLDKLDQIALEKNTSLFKASLYCIETSLFRANTTNNLTSFVSLISTLGEFDRSLISLYDAILDKTGFLEHLRREDTVESRTRIENLEELRNVINQFEERYYSQENEETSILQQFLEEIVLVYTDSSKDIDSKYVSLMTLHSSKGLEFPNIFMVGMEENIFPGIISITSADRSEMEEERRLCYVGMTRACEKLWLTHAKCRRTNARLVYNNPSRFIEEIPDRYLDNPIYNLKNNTSRPQPNGYTEYEEEFRQDEEFGQEVLKKGVKVVHPVFGQGKVLKLESRGEKISVLFDDSSVRKFMLKYTNLKPVI